MTLETAQAASIPTETMPVAPRGSIFNVTEFSDHPSTEAWRAGVSLALGLAAEYGIAAASGALVHAIAPHLPQLAEFIQSPIAEGAVWGMGVYTAILVVSHLVAARR